MALPTPNPEGEVTLLAAIDGREMVGAGLLMRPLGDNLHSATVDAYVRPDRAREGIGRRLVAELEVVAAGDGRTTLHGEAFLPPGASGTGPEAFAAALGYEVASRESIRELALADYLLLRDALADEVVAAAAYRVVTFDTVCPDEHVESFGRLLGMLLDEIPLGDLDLRASEWTVRADPRRRAAAGRHRSPPGHSPRNRTRRLGGRNLLTSASTTPTPRTARSGSPWWTRHTAVTGWASP